MPPVALRSREIRLASRPSGAPVPSDFELAEVDVPDPGDGEVVVRNAFVSVDPYMRGRMNDTRSYVPPFALGEPLTGGAVGQVVASRNDRWPVGAWVVHDLGWREVAITDGRGLRAVDPAAAPVSTALGVLGMPGLTAYVGVFDIGEVRAGETMFVSGAAGAVGSIAAQLARSRGARVVGSAGTAEKVAWLEELGLEGVFDYTQVSDARRIARARARRHRRVLRQRRRRDARGGDRRAPRRTAASSRAARSRATTRRARSRGHGTSSCSSRSGCGCRGSSSSITVERNAAFLAEVGPLVSDGTIRYRETVVDGVERAPEAFIGLLTGANIGKMLVRVGPEPEVEQVSG